MKKTKILVLITASLFSLILLKNDDTFVYAAEDNSLQESIIVSDTYSEESQFTSSNSLNSDEKNSSSIEQDESEEDIDKKTLEGIIENLKSQLEKYKDIVENDTLKTIINALISFLAAFGALWIKFRSFDKANLSLNASQQMLEIAKVEVSNLTKDIADLAKSVNNSETTSKGLTELFGKSINTLNSAIVRLTDRLDELENKVTKGE